MNVKDVFPKFSAILSEVSKTKNGIMVELYSALICYPLIRIMIAIAAKKSKVKITDFNFKKKALKIQGFLLNSINRVDSWNKSEINGMFPEKR